MHDALCIADHSIWDRKHTLCSSLFLHSAAHLFPCASRFYSLALWACMQARFLYTSSPRDGDTVTSLALCQHPLCLLVGWGSGSLVVFSLEVSV